MNLPPLICSNCGRTYDLPAHLSHGPCIGCQTINCRPQAEGESLDKLQRATRLRLEGNHGEALKCYEHVLVDYDDEHSALWGKLLCQYGVEFVTDPKTGVRHATVHIPTSRPMQLHADFARACELAPEDVRAQYEADAAYVDEALAEINRHKESSPPYDVFICHKTTHLTGPGYTEDYNRGVQLTMLLTAQGYRVFFAPLAGLTPGASYEAGIYYALWSAKVMLLVSSDAAFLASPWVKSEWSRYLEMLDDGANKHLIPLMYDRLPEGRMPREIRLRGLQSIRMDSDLDAKDKLLAAMAKYTGKGTPAPVQPVVVQPVQTAAPAPKAEPVKEQPAPAPKAEPVKPQPAPAPKAEPVKPQPAPVAKVAPVKPQPAPAPKAKPVKPQPAPAPKAEPVKPQPVAPASAPASDFDVTPVTGGVVIKKYTGSDVKLEIPAAIGGKPVLEIGVKAFENCTTLAMVVIPEGVKKLGDYAFKDCSGLQSVRLPDSLENMGQVVFWNCSKLEELRIPAKVTAGAITGNWFLGCKKLKQITTAPGSQLQVRDGVLFNQSGCLVAYPMALPARSYTAPAGTKEIAGRAFEGCSLEEIILPSGVTEVNYSAFADCAALKRLELPDSLRSIDDWAFESCGLPEVTIPEKTQVSYGTFCLFRGLLRVYRDSPAHVLAVKKKLRHEVIGGTYAVPSGAATAAPASDFVVTPVAGGVVIKKYTGSDVKLEIPAAIGGKPVLEIGEEAFEKCTTLAMVVIPEGVKKLGNYAFADCSGLQSVRLPDSLENMGYSVFWNCSKLEELRIPAKVTAGARTVNWFLGCKKLKKITTAPGSQLQVHDGVLFNQSGCLVAYPMALPARSYTAPAGTKEIACRAFQGCSLEEIILPSGVTEVNHSAFDGCAALKRLELPDSLRSIDDWAFRRCDLPEVTIPEKTQVSSETFDLFRGLLRVYRDSPAHVLAVKKTLRHEVIGGTSAVPSGAAPAAPASNFDVTPVTGGVAITKYTGSGGEVVIPATLGGRPVVEIGKEAFERCTTLTKAVIPEGVKALGSYAFHGCSELQAVQLPASLERMDSLVFWDCAKLAEIRIPARVTADASTGNWFLGCSRLKKITTADGAKLQVRDGVLFTLTGCLVAYPMGLTARSYTVPEGTQKIGFKAFEGCSLEEIILPSSVAFINNCAFKNCTALKTMRLPEGLTDVRDSLFDGCRSLTSVNIPEKVERINAWAFDNCKALSSLTIPAGVKTIDGYAFQRCPALLRVHENSAAHKFAQEKGLRFEIIDASAPAEPVVPRRPRKPAISEIGAADSCYQVTPVTGGVSITKYTGPGGEVTIPATIGGRPVVEIGKEAFERCTTLTKAVIPEGVKALGSYAFHGCSELQAVQLPASLERMDSLVFWDCAKLAEIRIPAKVTAGARTFNWFQGCKKLKQITTAPGSQLQVRDGVLFNQSGCLVAYPMAQPARSYTAPAGTKEIACRAFQGCSLEEIILPSGVTEVNSGAFDGCAALKRLELPDSLRSIGYFAFISCGLPEVTIPEKTQVSSETFDQFRGLLRVYRDSPAHVLAVKEKLRHEVIGGTSAVPSGAATAAPASDFDVTPVTGGVSITKYTGPGGEVTIPATIGGKPVVEIGNGAFVKCTALTRVIIPEGVTRIRMNAFFGCSSMRSVRIPDGVTEIDDSAFYDCTSLTIAEIPASVKNIGRSAFNGCHGLMSIWIPDGVMTIGDYAFFNCLGMRSARIPDSVKSIGDSAFGGCTSLRNLELPRKLPSIGTDAFKDCPLPIGQRLKLSLATKK